MHKQDGNAPDGAEKVVSGRLQHGCAVPPPVSVARSLSRAATAAISLSKSTLAVGVRCGHPMTVDPGGPRA
jgi:hypothetical protein